MANAFGQSGNPGGPAEKEREAASWRASTSATVSRLMEIVRQHDAQLRSLRNDHDALREEANTLRRSLDMFSTAAAGKKSPATFSARGRASSGGPMGGRSSSSGSGLDLATRGGRQAQDVDSAGPSNSVLSTRRQSAGASPLSRFGGSSDSSAALAIRRRNSDASFDKVHKNPAGMTDLWSVTKPLLEPGSSREQQIMALNCFKQALKAGVTPHNWSGPNTPLRTAVEAGRLDMVTELLKSRANPEESDSKGVSLLHLAAFSDKKEVCRSLLNAKAQTNAVDQHGQTPLFFAPTRTICDVLLSRRADTNVINNKGQSALHFAGQAGMSDVLLWLSQHVSPAVLDLRDDYNATGSYYAKAAGVKPEIYHRLQSGTQVANPGGPGSDRRLPTVIEEDSECGTPATTPVPDCISSGEESASERALEESAPATRVPWQTLSAARDSKANAAASSAPSGSRRLAAERAARPKAAWGSSGQSAGSPQVVRGAAARASAQAGQQRSSARGGRSHLDMDEDAFEMQHEEEVTRERKPTGSTHRSLTGMKKELQAASRDEIKARAMRMKSAREGQASRQDASAGVSGSPIRPADTDTASHALHSEAQRTNSPQSPQSDDVELQEDAEEQMVLAAARIQAAFRQSRRDRIQAAFNQKSRDRYDAPADKESAATQLQAAVRGRLARKSVRSLKQKITRESERSTDIGEDLLTAGSPTTTLSDD